jgi:hypothetical protein
MRAGVGQALVRDRFDKRCHLRWAERVTSTYGSTTGQSGCQVLTLLLRRRPRGRALHSFLESFYEISEVQQRMQYGWYGTHEHRLLPKWF